MQPSAKSPVIGSIDRDSLSNDFRNRGDLVGSVFSRKFLGDTGDVALTKGTRSSRRCETFRLLLVIDGFERLAGTNRIVVVRLKRNKTQSRKTAEIISLLHGNILD